MLLIIGFTLCAFFLFFLRPIASRINLVSSPCHRKLHQGEPPLIGGLAIFSSILIVLLLVPDLLLNSKAFLVSAGLVTLIGAIDDRFEISVKLRMLVLCVIAVCMVVLDGMQLSYLGDLGGDGDIFLSYPALIIFNIFAIIGALTAFNMVDGLDGLLASLAAVTLTAIGILAYYTGHIQLAYFCLLFIVTLIPFLLLNTSLFFKSQRKIFMGDAGAFFIGFTVIWLLIVCTQPLLSKGTYLSFKPVTALWIIAIPLMDMAATMIRRISNKRSPFAADREHLHHILKRIGFSSHKTVCIMVSAAAVFAIIGVLGEILLVAQSTMLMTFLLLFTLYLYSVQLLAKRPEQPALVN